MSSVDGSTFSSSTGKSQWASNPNTDTSNIHDHPKIALLNQIENKVVSLLEFASKFVDVESNADVVESQINGYLETMKDIKIDLTDIIRESSSNLTQDYNIADPWSVKRKSKELFDRKQELMKELKDLEDKECTDFDNRDKESITSQKMEDEY